MLRLVEDHVIEEKKKTL